MARSRLSLRPETCCSSRLVRFERVHCFSHLFSQLQLSLQPHRLCYLGCGAVAVALVTVMQGVQVV
jgi:hypothetical protein